MAALVDGTTELAATDGQGDAGEFQFHSSDFATSTSKEEPCKNPSSNSFHGLVGRDPSPNRPHSVSQSEACCLCERGDNICLVGSISQPGLYVDSRILDAGQHNADGFAHIQDRSLPAAPSLCLMEQGKGLDSALKQIQWIPLILLTRFIRGLMLPCQLLQR